MEGEGRGGDDDQRLDWAFGGGQAQQDEGGSQEPKSAAKGLWMSQRFTGWRRDDSEVAKTPMASGPTTAGSPGGLGPIDGGHKVPLGGPGGHLHRPRPEAPHPLFATHSAAFPHNLPHTLLVHLLANRMEGSKWSGGEEQPIGPTD